VERLGNGLRVATADNPGPLTLDGSRSYLAGDDPAVLIDPGPASSGQQELLQRLVEGRTVSLVCLTHAHADHAAAATEAADRFGCDVAASAETLARLDLVGRALADGEEIPVDRDADGDRSRLRVLATPGHTGDHLSFLWLPGRQLFTGDLVLGSGTSVILHPDGDVGAYLASLERLIGENPAVILPGHGEPVTRPGDVLRDYVEHRLEREAQIAAALAELDDEERSVEAIRDRVYGPLPPGIERAANASIRAHLRHIELRGGLPPVGGFPGDLDARGLES
jgi:glyoxylase-like metal-dependent hydrolase (beta-lactamase superfamily II)